MRGGFESLRYKDHGLTRLWRERKPPKGYVVPANGSIKLSGNGDREKAASLFSVLFGAWRASIGFLISLEKLPLNAVCHP